MIDDWGLQSQDYERYESAIRNPQSAIGVADGVYSTPHRVSTQDVLEEGSRHCSCEYTSVLRVIPRCFPMDRQDTVSSSW